MVSKHQIIKQFSSLPILRENEGPKKNKDICLRKIIKPIVHDCSLDFTTFASSIIMDLSILKTILDNLM